MASPISFARKPTLTGELVELRPLTAADIPAVEVVLNDLDTDNQSCGFRIALTSAHTGRGLGTEAIRLMLGHAFDIVGLHRVELEVYAFNPRARHVYEQVGFVYEGTKRQALRWQGEWIDTQVMAMLADDWAARRTSDRVSTRDT
jgi:RimJ/RimL family protein N-acetyltransferase